MLFWFSYYIQLLQTNSTCSCLDSNLFLLSTITCFSIYIFPLQQKHTLIWTAILLVTNFHPSESYPFPRTWSTVQYFLCILLFIILMLLIRFWILLHIHVQLYRWDLTSGKFYSNSYVFWNVHHCDGWRMKDQLDVTCYFISLLMCSTCFGH